MNKVFGLKTDYAPVKEDASRVIISYAYEAVDEDHATWREVYLYKRQHAAATLADVKAAILADINSRTTDRIVSGLVWTAADGEQIPVWLSVEQQLNFTAAYIRAVKTDGGNLPVTFKMGETEDGTPVSHTFETMEEADDFYRVATDHIHTVQREGWQEKDAIDWHPYEVCFPEADTQPAETESGSEPSETETDTQE